MIYPYKVADYLEPSQIGNPEYLLFQDVTIILIYYTNLFEQFMLILKVLQVILTL